MFTKLFFHYDGYGVAYKEPVLVTAAMVNAKHFELLSVSGRLSDYNGSVDFIHIEREYKKVTTDPWNDTGSPPICLLRMAFPRVNFCGRGIEIVGFEYPNLIWAGSMLPEFPGCEKMKLPRNRRFDPDHKPSYNFSNLHRQIIRIC
jgi:hypothetical protein